MTKEEIVRRFEAGESASWIVMTMSEPRKVMERIDLVNDTLRAELARRAYALGAAQKRIMELEAELTRAEQALEGMRV